MPRPVEGSKVHHVTPPPPPPPPKPKPAVVPKPVEKLDAGAASKKGEIENLGAATRQQINEKADYQQLVGAAVAGARGVDSATRPYSSTAERIGYAPRSTQANKAAQVFADTINEQIKAGKLPNYSDHNSIGAAIHKDRSITISASGDGARTKHLYDEKLYPRPEQNPTQEGKPATVPKAKLTDDEIKAKIAEGQGKTKAERATERQAVKDERALKNAEKQAAQTQLQDTIDNSPTLKSELQKNLNEAFKDDPTVKRTATGDVDFDWGKPDAKLTNLNESTVRNPKTGAVTPMTERNANNCAAGKMYHSDKTAGGKNPVVGADEVWRPDSANSHADDIKTNNPKSTSMCPCASCAGNVKEVTGGNARRTSMTLQDAGRTGATGLGVAAATSTLQQLWNTGTVDGKKLAQETAAGGVTAVAGEGLERALTPALSRGAARVIESGAGQSAIKNLGTAGTKLLDNIPGAAKSFVGNLVDKAPQSIKNFVGNTNLGKALGDSRGILNRATGGTSTLESKLLGNGLGKIGGAGAAGAIIGAGVETVAQWDNLQNKETSAKAAGSIAAQAAVGLAAGASGAAVGAAIGTAIPIPLVGTVVGAAVGFGVGYLASATGADKFIASGIEKLVTATGADQVIADATKNITEAAGAVGNAVSGAANKLASVFGW